MSFQSVVPPEALEHAAPLPPCELLLCPHGQLEGCRNAVGDFVVSRLLSTDPAAYLQLQYAPGAIWKQ